MWPCLDTSAMILEIVWGKEGSMKFRKQLGKDVVCGGKYEGGRAGDFILGKLSGWKNSLVGG